MAQRGISVRLKGNMEQFKIEIEDTPPSQNLLRNYHWSKKRKIKTEWEQKFTGYGYIWKSKFGNKTAHKVSITFSFPDLKRRDIDNFIYFKGILDGLRKSGIISDDNAKDIKVIYPSIIFGGKRATIIELSEIY